MSLAHGDSRIENKIEQDLQVLLVGNLTNHFPYAELYVFKVLYMVVHVYTLR